MNILIPLFASLALGATQLNQQEAEDSTIQADKINDSIYPSRANNAWTGGEMLKYRVHYGIVNAARIEMYVNPRPVKMYDREVWHIEAKGKSVRAFDWFFKVRDNFQTYIDQDAIQPHQFIKKMKEGDYEDSDFAIFNYKIKKVSSKKGSLKIPANIQDVISAIYYSRTLNIKNAKAGDMFPLSVYLDGEIYPLKIKYVGKEIVKTDIGKVHAVKVIPMVIADRVFKDEEGLELWVSDDENKVPLRVKAELAVGSIKVDLTEYKGLKHKLATVD